MENKCLKSASSSLGSQPFSISEASAFSPKTQGMFRRRKADPPEIPSQATPTAEPVVPVNLGIFTEPKVEQEKKAPQTKTPSEAPKKNSWCFIL